GRMVRRGSARAGDALYVSGAIGDAALGLRLRRGVAETHHWPFGVGERAALLTRYLRPEPRIALRDALLAHASAAMDISDGLALTRCGSAPPQTYPGASRPPRCRCLTRRNPCCWPIPPSSRRS